MYHLLRNEMGAAAPNKNQISTFMRALPSVQINKTTKSVAGKKNVIGPMIPRPSHSAGAQAIVLSYRRVTILSTRNDIPRYVCTYAD